VVRGLQDLRRMGVITHWAAGFIAIAGKRVQTARWTEQLGFWGPEEEVGAPHLVYEFSPGTFR
jgi:hypothetical protein